MKHLYCFLLFLFSINISFAQEEALLGQWTLDSIFDYDILHENPVNPITIEFSDITNSISINSFCGQSYESLYTSSTIDNAIELLESNWAPFDL
jgi:hypothetical protein